MKWEYKSVVLYVDPVADELNHYGQDGWELVELRDTVLVQVETMTSGEVIIAYFKRPLPEPEAKPVEIAHGVNCPKVEHDPPSAFIHSADFDGIYRLGDLPYCGRCHAWLMNYGKVKPVQSEADYLWEELAYVKKELEGERRRHADDNKIAVEWCITINRLMEAIKPINDHWEAQKPQSEIPYRDLQALGTAYRAAKATCAEVENGK